MCQQKSVTYDWQFKINTHKGKKLCNTMLHRIRYYKLILYKHRNLTILFQLLFIAGRNIRKFCEGYSAYVITRENLKGFPAKSNIKKRSTQHYFVGRRRGQTQSQYLNFGSSNEPGKAEAEFTAEGSRAVVSKYNKLLAYYIHKCNHDFSGKQRYGASTKSKRNIRLW